MSACVQCGSGLTFNEIGANKKFVSRHSIQYLCLNCLAAKLDVAVEELERKIEQFRLQGCELFV